ncbi:hypothetical protein [Paenibacillus camelliae]|uniref:hypothetical protein n=1 Tax=Paenibacillus camelliae TaxID=512410 RepID=UPI00203F6E07|nr:hypothetical protein [Paenibacillus camelliae]MCM3632900.1 hypothetical protein [Paenibacillus camelliae]
MNEAVEYEDVLVKLEIRTTEKITVIQINEEFMDKVVISLDIEWHKGKPVLIYVEFEDESAFDLVPGSDAFIYCTYQTVAIDGPAETK